MGKYVNTGRKVTPRVWDNPRENARRVIEANITAIRDHIGDMRDNYRNHTLETARNNEKLRIMQAKLGLWYDEFSKVAEGFAEIYARYLSRTEQGGIAPAPR